MDFNNLNGVNKNILGEYKLKLIVGDVIDEGNGKFVCTLAELRNDQKNLKHSNNSESDRDEDVKVVFLNVQSPTGWYIILEELDNNNKIIKNGKKIQGFQDARFSNDLGRLRVVGYINKLEYIEKEIVEKPKRQLKEITKRLSGIIEPKKEEIIEEPKKEPVIEGQLKLF